MKKFNLADFTKGWFIGNFEPSILKTNDVEVAIKKYKRGDFESWHYHKIATEFTVIVSGVVEMNGNIFREGDIIVIEPGSGSDFKVVDDAVTAVVKLPGANNDKYLK